MSNYEIIENNQYNDFRKRPINLQAYMLINDHYKSQKFLFLKLYNQEIYTIQSVSFKIKQYDASKVIINESDYVLNGLSFSPHKTYTPPKKYRLDTACASVEYIMVTAETNDSIWTENHWNNKANEELDTPITVYQDVIKQTHKNITLRHFITLALLIVYITIITLVFYVENA